MSEDTDMPNAFFRKRVAGYCAAVLGIVGVTAICAPLHQRFTDTTAALAMLLVVLFVALGWGHLPALVASVFGMLCLNYFFLPPTGTLTIADPENWVALFAFLTTAVTVGELSARVRQRAADAETGRRDARRVGAYNRSLIEASIDPLVTIGKDGKITDANPAAEMATGRSRAELMGTDFSDYFTEPEKARQGYQQVFEEGLVRDYPLEMRHCTGITTPILYNATVYRDDAGAVAGVFAAARDISKRRQAEQELRRMMETLAVERKRFLDVLDMLPAYVVLLTPDYHVPFANRFFRERFGESHGRRCFEYLFGRSEPCEVCDTYRVLKTMEPGRWEWTGPDGRDYDIFDFPLADTDETTLILEMGLDITERKRADGEIRSLARLQAGLAEMGQKALRSHQLGVVLDEAVALVARTLDVEYCNVLELLPDGSALVLRSGVGWNEKLVGRATVSTGADSQAGYTLLSGEPVIVEDLQIEKRFSDRTLLHEYGVVSGITVLVGTSAGPFGVMGVYTRRRRSFTKDEAHFLETVGSVLGNVLERQRAEEALRQSEANLNRAQEIAHIGSWRLDVRHNQLTWSDEVFRMFDMSKGVPLTHEDFLEAVYAEDRERVEEAWGAALRGAPYDIEHRILVGGELKWVRERAKVEFEEGEPVEGIGTIQDVTTRRLAQETLQKSANEIRDLYDNAPCGYHSLDEDGTFVRINHTELAWLGYTREELIGKMKFSDVLTPEGLKSFQQSYPRFKTKGAIRDLEFELVRRNGTILPVLLSATAITDRDGNYLMSRSTVYDITERKRAEREIRRISRTNRALSRCNEAVIRATDESTLLQKVCEIIVEEAGYRFCWVGGTDRDPARSIRPIAQAGFEDGYLNTLKLTWADTERGQGPTGTCIRTHQTVLAQHIATDPMMTPWRTEAIKRCYASSIAIPLLIDSEVFGALTIYASEPDAFGTEEVKLLAELANDLAFGIVTLRTKAERARAEAEIRALNAGLERHVLERTAELRAANAELERAREREVEIASRIQQTLLLDQPPADVPGLRVAALSLPSQRIDGDFYTFFKHADGSLDVIVGDVMGKGIPAALLGAATKSRLLKAFSHLVASQNGKPPEPKEIVMLAHSEIVRQLIDLDSFVTLCYARLHVSRRHIELVDCGHTGTIQWHARTGRCGLLHGDNLPLGIREDESYKQICVPFEPGDLFFFYSDGITEARNSAGELFGLDRLEQAILRGSELEPEALVQAIRQAVAAFSGSQRLTDDLTSVAVRALARAELEIRSDLHELRRAREFVRMFCRDAPGSPLAAESVNALELAVHEAASNIIKHAYGGRTDQWIHLGGEAFPGQVSIRLRHMGVPFEPSTAPPPAFDGSRESGFGAYIISRSVDEVRYYRDQWGRSCVALVKNQQS